LGHPVCAYNRYHKFYVGLVETVIAKIKREKSDALEYYTSQQSTSNTVVRLYVCVISYSQLFNMMVKLGYVPHRLWRVIWFRVRLTWRKKCKNVWLQ